MTIRVGTSTTFRDTVRAAASGKRVIINGWCAIPDAFSAELMAAQGWDSVTIDMQHGLADYRAAIDMLRGVASRDVWAMVRLPWIDPGLTMKLLDFGADGVVCPMVSSAAEAATVVSHCRYPPEGARSHGPLRAALGDPDYPQKANDRIVVGVQIEDRGALENASAIAETPGVDLLYVGPADLSRSLGYPPALDVDTPELLAAFDRVLEAAGRAGKAAGIHCVDPAYAEAMVRRGFGFVTVSSDTRLLAAAAQHVVAAMRGVRSV